MKRPASQYYWGDWRRDTALQGCSIAARGLWHEMNCLMHDCEPYGHLRVGSGPMPPAKLARLAGISPKECVDLLAELEDAGIFSRTEDGTIYSRRMVRDEELRERRASGGKAGAEHGIKGAEHGIKGGRPRATEVGSETPLPGHEKPPPASASASALGNSESVSSTPRARAGEDDPPEAGGYSPTAAGLACRAMRDEKLAETNPGDPRLIALLEQGATVEEFAGIAGEAVRKGKGFAWVLVTLQARRAEAAAIALAPKVPDESERARLAAAEAAEATRRRMDAEDAERRTPEAMAASTAARQRFMEGRRRQQA